jgi:hypothetical protein
MIYGQQVNSFRKSCTTPDCWRTSSTSNFSLHFVTIHFSFGEAGDSARLPTAAHFGSYARTAPRVYAGGGIVESTNGPSDFGDPPGDRSGNPDLIRLLPLHLEEPVLA